MGDKDISEKALLRYADVFADIVNVLLFDGEQRILPNDLTEVDPHTYYNGKQRQNVQIQDIVKYWKKENIQIACIGFENQTSVDPNMVFRVISYDGARYRAQLNQELKHFYPVITLVLYYGNKNPWQAPCTIHERLHIPAELKPYVSDYSINLFDIAYLSEDTVSKFQSDFQIVVDYFVQKRLYHDYKPSEKEIQHVEETLYLLSAISDDRRFEEISFNRDEEVPHNMCEILDRVEQRGFQAGYEQGIEQGIEQGKEQGIEIGTEQGRKQERLHSLFALMSALHLSPNQAMDILQIPELEREYYMERLSL